MTPGHIVDMEKTIEATEINEGTEGCEGLDNALYHITNVSSFEELLSILLDLVLKILSSGNHTLQLCSIVELVNDEVVCLANKGLRIFNSYDICL